jgi:hypothetical protein
MTCDHRLGYAPAASPDFNGLVTDDWWLRPMEGGEARADACGQRRRRYVDPACMTKGDHEGHERDLQAGRLERPVFHVEQPGTLVFYDPPVEVDMIQGLEAAALSAALKRLREAEQHAMFAAEVEAKQAEASAHARAMGEAHQQRMLKLQAEVRACVGMQQGDSGWRDWNDG